MASFYKTYIQALTNKYVIIFVIFLIWMLFFDAHSFLFHRELNKEINELNYQKDHYKNQIERDKKEMKALKTQDGIERTAREDYYMKKENEDIYIIEYQDSIKKDKKDE